MRFEEATRATAMAYAWLYDQWVSKFDRFTDEEFHYELGKLILDNAEAVSAGPVAIIFGAVWDYHYEFLADLNDEKWARECRKEAADHMFEALDLMAA